MSFIFNKLKPFFFIGGFLLATTVLTAQTQKVQVVEVNYIKGLINKEKFKKRTYNELTQINFEPKLLKRVKYGLRATQNKSFFTLKEGLASDSRLINKRYRDESVFYTNQKTKEKFSQEEWFGKKFLIKHPFTDYKWELTNDFKTILGLRCRKAIGYEPVYSEKKGKTVKSERLLIAWFTTKIPISAGPDIYGGLPGLILEIIFWPRSYVATDIKVKQKPRHKIKISKPTEGQPITEAELKQKIIDFVENMKGFHKTTNHN